MNKYKVRYVYTSILSISFFLANVFSQQQVKKIVSRETEYDTSNKIIKFFDNVKIEIKDGYVLCNEAIYYEKEKNIYCEGDVYALLVSTEDDTTVEIFSNTAEYSSLKMEVVFKGNPRIVYKSKKTNMQNIKLSSDEVLLDEKNSIIVCKNNVVVENVDGKIFCDIARYDSKEKMIYLNESDEVEKVVKFYSLNPETKVKRFVSKRAICDVNKEKFFLYSVVEMVCSP